mgnify:FL=1
MNKQQLFENIKKKQSFLCVGLDTDIKKIPQHLLSEEDPIFAFNKAIIDATADYCVAYKPNLAFYESLGVKGMLSFEKTVAYLRENYPDQFIIADAKRGDIGNTSEMYARSFFDHIKVDAVTVAPYMGEDSVKPFLIYQEAYYDPAQMVLKVEAKEYSSSAYNNKVYLPLYGAVDVTVNWGDGQSEPVAATISTAAAMVNHTYAESGIYYVTISGTTEKLSGRLTNKTVAPAILEVRQWGKLGMTTLDYAFANTSLVTVPQPEEDAFAAVTSVENMFSGCTLSLIHI